MKLKELPKVDLPREKLEKYGPKKLHDHELLAILLDSGIEGMNVLELSKKILKIGKQLGMKKLTLDDLLKIKGLGKAKASKIIAMLELGSRLSSDATLEILSPEDVWKLCADFRESKREHFVAFYLDTQNRLIERQIISIGTLNASLVHPREVFEPALKLSAASIILAHNHPSASVKPSDEDLKITDRLIEAGEIIGIRVVDHVVVTGKSFLSIFDKNLSFVS